MAAYRRSPAADWIIGTGSIFMVVVVIIRAGYFLVSRPAAAFGKLPPEVPLHA